MPSSEPPRPLSAIAVYCGSNRGTDPAFAAAAASLDVAGYFAPLRDMLDAATRAGFVIPAHRNMVITESEPAALLDRLAVWTPVRAGKWLDKSER